MQARTYVKTLIGIARKTYNSLLFEHLSRRNYFDELVFFWDLKTAKRNCAGAWSVLTYVLLMSLSKHCMVCKMPVRQT